MLAMSRAVAPTVRSCSRASRCLICSDSSVSRFASFSCHDFVSASTSPAFAAASAAACARASASCSARFCAAFFSSSSSAILDFRPDTSSTPSTFSRNFSPLCSYRAATVSSTPSRVSSSSFSDICNPVAVMPALPAGRSAPLQRPYQFRPARRHAAGSSRLISSSRRGCQRRSSCSSANRSAVSPPSRSSFPRVGPITSS